AQRQAIVDMLQGGGQRGQAGLANIDPQQLSVINRLLLQEQQGRARVGLAEEERKLSGGDTIVIDFSRREDVTPRPNDGAAGEVQELLQRLAEGNPYELDSAGQLYLPGIPAIALAGLNEEQATVRLEA